MAREARRPGDGLCSLHGGSDPACGGLRSRGDCTPHKAQVLSGSGGWDWGWSAYVGRGESWGWCVCYGGVDCWCEGSSGRAGCSAGVMSKGCWCVSSGLCGTVYCDGECHGEPGSCECVCLHSG